MKKINLIPDISDDELIRRIKFFVPCVVDSDGVMSECKMKKDIKTLRNFSFNWTDGDKVLGKLMSDGSVRDEIRLKLCFEIVTYHTWSYYGFFKPTVAEVLSQIPESIMKQIKTEMYFCTKVITAEGDNITLIDNDYHIGRTKFFMRELETRK